MAACVSDVSDRVRHARQIGGRHSLHKNCDDKPYQEKVSSTSRASGCTIRHLDAIAVGYAASVWAASVWISGFAHEDWRDPFNVYFFAAWTAILPGFVVLFVAVLISFGIFGIDKTDDFPPLKRLKSSDWKSGAAS